MCGHFFCLKLNKVFDAIINMVFNDSISAPHRAPQMEKTMAKKKEQAAQAVVAYKGFNQDWTCRDFQYEVGKSYEHNGDVEACSGGFHACEYPLHVLRYYKASQSRFAIVEQSGTLSRHDEDSKIASSHISVKAEIDIAGLIKAAVKYTMDRCTPAEGSVGDKDSHLRRMAEALIQKATGASHVSQQ